MEYDNCLSYFRFGNVSLPISEDHIKALGSFGEGVGIFGTVSTLILAVLFTFNVFTVIRRNPIPTRRYLVWITSFPMLVSFLALVTFLVPRSAIMCDTIKQSYMPFLLVHFVDLTLMLEGGQTEASKRLVAKDVPVTLCAFPFCCFGLCFRNLIFDKKKLRFVKGLVYQMPLFQLVTLVLISMLEGAGLIRRTLTDGIFLFVCLFYVLLFCLGMWAFNILAVAFAPHIKWNRFLLKARVLSFSIVILKIQTFIFILITGFTAKPCILPYLSPVYFRRTMDAALNLIECFIYGIIFFIVFKERVDHSNSSNVELESETNEQQQAPPAYYINQGAEMENELSKNPVANENIYKF